jgi:hypothetical protein
MPAAGPGYPAQPAPPGFPPGGGPQRSRGPLIALLVAIVVILVALAGILVWQFTKGDGDQAATDQPTTSQKPSKSRAAEGKQSPSPTETATIEPTTVMSQDLQTGDCFARRDEDREDGDDSFTVVDCFTPHWGEVAGKVYLTHDTDLEDTTALINLCLPLMDDYMGEGWRSTGALDGMISFPDPDDWEAGDRTMICSITAYRPDDDLYTRVRGAFKNLTSSETPDDQS